MNHDLKPCPFCPESVVSLCDNQAVYIPALRYLVCCGRCGTQSGHCRTEARAIALWNTRHEAAKASEQPVMSDEAKREALTLLHSLDAAKLGSDLVSQQPGELPQFSSAIENALEWFEKLAKNYTGFGCTSAQVQPQILRSYIGKARRPTDADEGLHLLNRGLKYIYEATPCDMPWSPEEIAKMRSSLIKREASTQDHIICTDGTRVEIDPEFYPLLSQHNWYINMSGKKPYVITKLKTDQTTIWRCIFMHHLIMGSSAVTDHIDGNPLNNRKSNLRLATRQENGWNTVKRQRTSSGGPPSSQYKGVSKCIGANNRVYYRVIIKLSKKGEKPERFVRLGPFDTEIEAAVAYNEEIVKHRGEFAMLNQITAKGDSA